MVIHMDGNTYRIDYNGGVEVRTFRETKVMSRGPSVTAWRSLKYDGKIATKVRNHSKWNVFERNEK